MTTVPDWQKAAKWQPDTKDSPKRDSGPEGSPLSAAPLLPEEFWNARTVHKLIRQAAHYECTSADTTFGAVLARTSAMVHHRLRFDLGGGEGSLNYNCIPVGPPEAGKTTSVTAAKKLVLPPSYLSLPDGSVDFERFRDGIGLGSGEGIAELYMGVEEVEDGTHERGGKNHKAGDPKYKLVRRQVRHNAFLYVDEGGTANKLMLDRKGSTLGETIRTAWTGKALGQANAQEATTRMIPDDTYALGIVIGYQINTAQALLGDGGAGTPQRFAWLWAADKNIPDVRPACVDPFRVEVLCNGKRTATAGVIRGNDRIAGIVRSARVQRARGEVVIDQMDAHWSLMMCKNACLLAVLDGRTHVTDEDWELAQILWDTSCAVRRFVLGLGKAEARREQEQRDEAFAERAARAHRKVKEIDDAPKRVARVIARKVREFVENKADNPGGQGPTSASIYRKVAARDRSLWEDALDEAVRRGFVRVSADETLTLGDVAPL